METYDIYFKEGNDFANKGFSLKDKAKAIRMAEDMLAERKGYVKDFVGGTISVMPTYRAFTSAAARTSPCVTRAAPSWPS